jgi:integrase
MKGSLVYYKDDIWHYTIDDHTAVDENGKKKRVRKKFTIVAQGKTFAQKQKNAEEQAEDIWRRFKEGDRFWEADINFGDYLDRFLADGYKPDDPKNSRWKRQGYIWYERRIRCHIKPKLGHYKISEITTRIIKNFLEEVATAGKFIPTHCYAILRAVWQQMIWDGDVGVKENIILRVHPPKVPEVNNPIWDIDQVKIFLKAVEHYRYHLVYFVAFTTGMRINEILGLRWRDIDFENGIINVRNKIEKSGLKPMLGTPKTKKSLRPIKMIPKLAKELAQHKKQQAAEILAVPPGLYQDYGPEFRDLVFTKQFGGPVDHDYLRKKEFIPAIKKCQEKDENGNKKETWIPYIAIRDLRHSAASYLIDIGTPVEIVAEILGHSTPLITRKFYVKDNVKRQEKAMERMAEDFV